MARRGPSEGVRLHKVGETRCATWITTNTPRLSAHFTSGQLAIVDIMPSILQHLHIVAPPAVAREMEGRSFLR